MIAVKASSGLFNSFQRRMVVVSYFKKISLQGDGCHTSTRPILLPIKYCATSVYITIKLLKPTAALALFFSCSSTTHLHLTGSNIFTAGETSPAGKKKKGKGKNTT